MAPDARPWSTEEAALALDSSDSLRTRRDLFHIPAGHPSGEVAYLAGNSLGLQPRAVQADLQVELDDWASLGVEGHVASTHPWVSYHALLREPAARLVGALPEETVVMNTLTVNLHLLMISFYRPTPERRAILIEDAAFPSDSYAARSQVALHGYDPDKDVIRLAPRPGEDALRSEDVIDFLATEGDNVALVMLGAVNYYSGEYLDIEAITRAGHEAGAVVGWDLAHAVGNVPLKMHEWNVDWAVWCSYKYLNSGPGAVAGAFVHSRHLADRSIPKLSGWWSTNPDTRFRMEPVIDAVHTADAWQLSNPPILGMAPVLTSLRIFDEVGMDALREKSIRLTGYLQDLLDEASDGRPLEIITPRDPERRGAQLSVRLIGLDAEEVRNTMSQEWGVVTDARQPDVIRFAPTPLYCTFHDCWRAARALAAAVDVELAKG
ncbi:kynureninase [Streptomyces sp. NPDC006668]|uniref:kynureninase n=1 Tax=Streptomyces sp. NPDC006668 TaxID=3156903 RepID=UPI0033D8A8D7